MKTKEELLKQTEKRYKSAVNTAYSELSIRIEEAIFNHYSKNRSTPTIELNHYPVVPLNEANLEAIRMLNEDYKEKGWKVFSKLPTMWEELRVCVGPIE